LRIVVICRGGEGSSVARVAFRQSLELAKEFEVVYVGDLVPPPDAPFRRVSPGARNWSMLRRFAHVPAELSFARAARRRVRELRPDFVLCHSHVVAAHLAGVVPYGMVVHGDIFERPKGSYDRRVTALYRRFTPPAYRSAALVVILSPPAREWVVSGCAREEAIELIPNGIDPAELGAIHAPTRREHRVLYAGRLGPEKGVDDLIEAIRIARVPLTIAGAGRLEADLRRRAAGLPIEFIGSRPRATLGALYASHSVTCVPSISDPLPTVVLESLACGTPVVGTRIGGIPFMVEDGVNGLLVPPRDPVALAAALGDHERLARLAANTRASVLPRFSWTAAGERLRDAIRKRLGVCAPER
jgi:glycosyltransferase involved in cell wall biosynthesis